MENKENLDTLSDTNILHIHFVSDASNNDQGFYAKYKQVEGLYITIILPCEPRHEQTSFCICENKDADQLRGNREADQRLCFRYFDSTTPLLLKSEILSFLPSSVAVQPGLCRTWSETPKTGFLTSRVM